MPINVLTLMNGLVLDKGRLINTPFLYFSFDKKLGLFGRLAIREEPTFTETMRRKKVVVVKMALLLFSGSTRVDLLGYRELKGAEIWTFSENVEPIVDIVNVFFLKRPIKQNVYSPDSVDLCQTDMVSKYQYLMLLVFKVEDSVMNTTRNFGK